MSFHPCWTPLVEKNLACPSRWDWLSSFTGIIAMSTHFFEKDTILFSWICVYLVCFSEKSQCVALTSLKRVILLPQSPKCARITDICIPLFSYKVFILLNEWTKLYHVCIYIIQHIFLSILLLVGPKLIINLGIMNNDTIDRDIQLPLQ